MWGSAFAACVMQSSLTCQFEQGTFGHDLNLALDNLFFIAISFGLIVSVLR